MPRDGVFYISTIPWEEHLHKKNRKMLNSLGITEYRATFEGLCPSSGLLACHSIASSLSSGLSARQSKTNAEQHVPKHS